MSLSKNRVRWAAAILAVAAVALAAACEPAKKAPPKDVPPATAPPPLAPKPGENIAAYFVIDGVPPSEANTTRSTSPFSAPFSTGQGTASQALHPDGSVTLLIDVVQPTTTKTTGFNLKFRRLGDVATAAVHLAAASDDVVLSLLFDMNGDGVFSFASDKVASGPPTVAGALTINDQTSFQMELVPGNPVFTLANLKNGNNTEDIDADTPVSIVIALTSAGLADMNATVDSLTVNNKEMLVP